jgi:hypothetical protein
VKFLHDPEQHLETVPLHKTHKLMCGNACEICSQDNPEEVKIEAQKLVENYQQEVLDPLHMDGNVEH